LSLFWDIADRLGGLVVGPEEWRYFRYKRAKKIARRYGYEIYKSHMVWFADPDFLAAKAEAEARAIAGIPQDRCYVLLDCARNVRDVPGEAAECGVRYGKSSLFLLTGLGGDSAKTFHIFDSFEGLSEPGAGDADDEGEVAWEQGELAVSEATVRRNLSVFASRLVFHKGWIPARFPEVEELRFALVHVDVDLYEPTRDAVEFFYPRLSPGGMLICDDYGSAYCPGAKRAVDEFFADKPERVLALPTGQSVVIKR
jgi:hypothetical protein